MKLIYIANIRLPTEKAHGIQIMKMCEAFANTDGVTVELVVPWRFNTIKEDPFAYYGVEKKFTITNIPSLDIIALGRIGFWAQTCSFSMAILWRFYGFKKQENIIFYSRDEMPAYFLALFGRKVVWEAHTGYDNFFIRSLIRHDVPIVCISGGLGGLYRSYRAKKVLISPDGVDIEQFHVKESKDEARIKLGLPREAKLIMYTGHLYPWKGVDVLAEATPELDDDAYVVFVGGTGKDVSLFKNKYGEIRNIIILGNKPHHKIPMYLRAADVLVIPNSAKEKISRLYTSPMKLFEYMASGTPIVASRMPSLQEVLDEKNSIMVLPDNPKSLAEGIKLCLDNSINSKKLAEQARNEVEEYTWKKRAQKIILFISDIGRAS